MARKIRAFFALFLHSLLVLWLVVTFLFCLLAVLRGNPISLYLDPRLTPELQDKLKLIYGYDAGHFERYVRYLGNVATGELGVSFVHSKPVTRVLRSAIGRSLWLGSFSFFLAVVLCGGLLVTSNQRGFPLLKRFSRFLVPVILSLPAFTLAALAISFLGVRFDWFPIYGTGSLFRDGTSSWAQFGDLLRHSILPGFSIAIPLSVQFVAYFEQRLENLDEAPFVISARGRGVSERRIFFNHKLRTIFPSFIQLCGLYLPAIICGVVIVEAMFGWSGFSALLIDATMARDYPLLMGCSIWCAALLIPGYELADYIRARLGEGESWQ